MQDCDSESASVKDQPDQTSKGSNLEDKKLRLEVIKLRQEVRRLGLENRHWATLGRNIWPLVSGILTIAVSFGVGFATWKAQTFSAEEDRKKIFFSAAQMATDAKIGNDGRIAGIWTLSGYWHDPDYSTTVANTLAAILVADAASPGSEEDIKFQRVRDAAAQVIGIAIDDKTRPKEADRLRLLLYGDGSKEQLGAVTSYQQELRELEKSAQGSDLASINRRLDATREAIRRNWEHLESSDFYNHDLSWIKLYEAHAKDAYFTNAILEGANLCGADLTGAHFDGADLSHADLAGATLTDTKGWESAKLTGANIHSVKGAPPEFTSLTSTDHPYDQDFKTWLESSRRDRVDTPAAVFTSCDKY